MEMLPRALYNILTIYMICVILRSFASPLGLEVESGRLKFIGQITNPLLNRIRKALPPLGPMDFTPIAAIFAVWLVRELSLILLVSSMRG